MCGGEGLANVLEGSSGNTLSSENSSSMFGLDFVVEPSNCTSYSHRIKIYRDSGGVSVRPATVQEVEMWGIITRIMGPQRIDYARHEGDPVQPPG